jgi:hypothetical protein
LLTDRLKPSGKFFYRGPMFVIDGLKTIGCLGSLLEVLKLRRQWLAFGVQPGNG